MSDTAYLNTKAAAGNTYDPLLLDLALVADGLQKNSPKKDSKFYY